MSFKSQIRNIESLEFLIVVWIIQLICIIPLGSTLNLSFETTIIYMVLPLGFVAYSQLVQSNVRKLKLKNTVFTILIFFFVTLLVTYVFYKYVLGIEFTAPESSKVLGIIALQAAFVAPVEEIVFRYFIPKIIESKLVDEFAFLGPIIASGLFAVFHYTAYSGDWSSILVAFIIAMIWCVCYEKWGVGATIGSHCAYNLVLSGLLSSVVVGGV